MLMDIITIRHSFNLVIRTVILQMICVASNIGVRIKVNVVLSYIGTSSAKTSF